MSDLQADNAMDILNEYKKSRLQRTFDAVAQILVVLFLSLLIYYNGLMLLPHVTPICWAVLWALFLNKPLQIVTNAMQWADRKIARYKLTMYILTACVYFGTFFTASLLTITIATLCFSIWSFLLWGDRSTVSVLLLLAGGLVLLGLPTFVIIRSCVEESNAIAIKIRDFVEKNPQFQTLLNDFGNSPYYKWVLNYASSWGVEIPEFDVAEIKDRIIALGMQFSSHFTDALGGVLGMLSDGMRMIVSFLTFASALFYLLQTSRDITGLMRDLSPFSEEDTVILMNSLNRSVISVFLSSFFVGLSHFLGTYMVFWFLSIDLALILSLICGFTSMLPIVGSWIVWLPIAVGLGLSGEHLSCLIVVLIQLLLQGPVDSLIYSTIPGNSFMVGMALAMGIYVFGTLGVIMGPLLTGLCVTICDIYRTYQNTPHIHVQSPNYPHHGGFDHVHHHHSAIGTKNNTSVIVDDNHIPNTPAKRLARTRTPKSPTNHASKNESSLPISPTPLQITSSYALSSPHHIPPSPYTDMIACELASPGHRCDNTPNDAASSQTDHSFMARLTEAIAATGSGSNTPSNANSCKKNSCDAENQDEKSSTAWNMKQIFGFMGFHVADDSKVHQE